MRQVVWKSFRAATSAAVALLCLVGAAGAQVYDHPQLITPYDETGIGAYLIVVNDINDLGGMVTYRKAGDVNLGVRGSINATPSDDVALNAGLDVYKQFVEVSDSFPLDVAWVTGFGFGYATGSGGPFGSYGILRIPGGISVARQFLSDDGEWALVPYLSPRLALDIGVSGPDTKLHFDTDLGLEMRFSNEWLFRFGLTLGNNNALGFGIVF